jgi:hypothetical protein
MVGSKVSNSGQVSIVQAVQLTGLHENTIRRFIKKALATDQKASNKIIHTRRGYRLDRAYLLAGVGQEPPAAARTTQEQPQPKRQLVKITIWARPAAKDELQRVADAEGLTLSRTGAGALEDWLARRSHVQHRGIFQPMIEKAIAKEMRAYSSRIAALEVRSLFIAEQTRAIVYNLLRKPPLLPLSDDAADKIIDDAKTYAKHNIGRVDPALTPLMPLLEQWLEQGVRGAT